LKDEVAEPGEGGARGFGHRDYYVIIHIIAGKQKANFAGWLKPMAQAAPVLRALEMLSKLEVV
jgi:hypothetical protein